MNALPAVLRRHALLLIALVAAGYFAASAYVNRQRVAELCNSFAAVNALVERALPETSPLKPQIDDGRQGMAVLCAAHMAEERYPETRGD
jgi:hypothetical protein